jgi:hypothetical protein
MFIARMFIARMFAVIIERTYFESVITATCFNPVR